MVEGGGLDWKCKVYLQSMVRNKGKGRFQKLLKDILGNRYWVTAGREEAVEGEVGQGSGEVEGEVGQGSVGVGICPRCFTEITWCRCRRHGQVQRSGGC